MPTPPPLPTGHPSRPRPAPPLREVQRLLARYKPVAGNALPGRSAWLDCDAGQAGAGDALPVRGGDANFAASRG